MLVTFQTPVSGLIGKLEHKGKFYIRKPNGKYILQRCPNRRNHVPTDNEKANQQRFAARYAGKKRKSDRCAISRGNAACLKVSKFHEPMALVSELKHLNSEA